MFPLPARSRRLCGSLILSSMLSACAAAPPAWQARLTGPTVALLGEVHDNAEQHRLRLEALTSAVERGWRPVIAMEQFDTDRQGDIDRARAERPRDAQHVIDLASPPKSGWDWDLYRPVIQLTLQYELPLIAANLSATQTRRIVREGMGAAFEPSRLAALGLDRPVPGDLSTGQQREIADGHCGALPERLLPAMANAQYARDAVMADVLARHADRGVVLIAGNGHVRRDLGVPRWLPAGVAERSLAVGYLEAGPAALPARVFDAVVTTPAAKREDPCASFKPPAR